MDDWGYFFDSTLVLIDEGWLFYDITDDEWGLSYPETYEITFPIKLVLLSSVTVFLDLASVDGLVLLLSYLSLIYAELLFVACTF